MEAARCSLTCSSDSCLRLVSMSSLQWLRFPRSTRSPQSSPFASHCPSWRRGTTGSCSCKRKQNGGATRGWSTRQQLQWLRQPLRKVLTGFGGLPPGPQIRKLVEQSGVKLRPSLDPHSWGEVEAEEGALHLWRLCLRPCLPLNHTYMGHTSILKSYEPIFTE